MIYAISGLICHQMPERSIFIGGAQLPLCARCTGIYGSIFIFFLYFLLRKRFRADYPPKTGLLIFTVCCLAPFMYDGGSAYMGFHATNNLTRILTGAFAGLPLSFLIIFLLNLKTFMSGGKHEPIIKNAIDILPLIICILFSYAVYRGSLPWIIPAVVSFLGLVSFFGLLIFILGRAVYGKITKRKLKNLNGE